MLSLHSSYKQTRKSTTDYRFNPRTIVTVPLFTIVAVSAIMTGRLSVKDFLNGFKNSFVSSFKQIAPHVRHDDTDEIVKQMKDSAGLK